jgi:uncharacterized membrane protein/predicted DsbA family dithiol-disulfide isomerase
VRTPGRLAWVRLVAFAGLAASALLAAEVLRPGRRFCPVDEACAAARSSDLGSVLGYPTSVLGVVAFGAFLALTFSTRGRRWLRPAGLLAAAAGVGLLAYQAVALDAFCPLCVVCDLAGVALGALLLPRRPPAAGAGKARWPWAVAASLAVALPLVWPQAEGAGWSALEGAGTASGTPRLRLVEYLNPFCAHCRATHARLARALEGVRAPVERERLYAWSGKAPPLWAKACVCAQDQGRGTDLERPFFRELLAAGRDRPEEVWAAARRAGLDVASLRACVERGDADERLGWVRDRVRAARIRGMPTLDVGRRRLEGEQSEAELRAALAAAEDDLRAAGGPR